MKISLVVSDFHIGAGRYLPDGTPNTLEVFHEDRRFIQFLEYHCSGQYADAEVELVLNGDFFNLLQIGYDEPDPTSITESNAIGKLDRILDGHPEVFEALGRFAHTPNKRVVCMLGNHDPGLVFDGLKDRIIERIGGDWEFHIDPYVREGVYIDHGNIHDISNRHDPNKLLLTRGLPEPILNLPWASYFLIRFVNRIKEERPYIDIVHPFKKYMRWTLFNDFWWGLWTRLRTVGFFFASLFSPRGKRPGFAATVNMVRAIRLGGGRRDEAAARRILRRKDLRVVILGHFHRPTHLRIGPGKSYINTGTWNHIVSFDPGSLGTRSLLTYAHVEFTDQGPRATLKEWLGRHEPERELDWIG